MDASLTVAFFAGVALSPALFDDETPEERAGAAWAGDATATGAACSRTGVITGTTAEVKVETVAVASVVVNDVDEEASEASREPSALPLP